MQSNYNKEFDIPKSDWEKNCWIRLVYYLTKLKYFGIWLQIVNNLLSNYFMHIVSKNCDNICKICTEKVEYLHHLIFEYVNVYIRTTYMEDN